MQSCSILPELPPAGYLSPGLVARSDRAGNAIELKFLMPVEKAERIRDRASVELARDPYSDSVSGSYDVCSLYLDTPDYAILHRRPELRGSKYRIRRYNASSELFLERKEREDGVVRKNRHRLTIDTVCEFMAQVSSLQQEIRSLELAPSCAVRYRRDAFYDANSREACRVTVDNDLRAIAFRDRSWNAMLASLHGSPDAKHIDASRSQFLFEGWSVVEFKFIDCMPVRLKNWVENFQLMPMKFSKYRTSMVVGYDG